MYYSYNELEQLHMQVLLNCHLAAFFVHSIQILIKRPNDNLITLACVIALVHYSYSTYSMGKSVSTLPQLDISSCSYQLF